MTPRLWLVPVMIIYSLAGYRSSWVLVNFQLINWKALVETPPDVQFHEVLGSAELHNQLQN